MRTSILLASFLTLLSLGCRKDQSAIDREKILQYLADNNITNAVEDPSGIFHVIDQPGSGGHPNLASTVIVKYKGYFLDKTVFDQTDPGKTIEFPLFNLIQGWQIAIPLLQKGGKGTFWIPSELGYGSNPPGGIPADAVLIFEIELVDFY